MADSSKTKKTRKSYTISFKIRVVMKALENNRNIAKTAREFGIHRKQVGGQKPSSLCAQFVFRAHPLLLPICARVPPISSVCI